MARVVVTGAAGLFGSRLVPLLAQRGHEVVAVVRPGSRPSLPPGSCQLLEQDLALWKAEELSAADAIVYLAQSRRYRDFPEGAADVVEINVRGVVSLAVRALRLGVQQVVYASSGTVYAPSFGVLTEASPIAPRDFYGYSKICAERLLQCFDGHFDVKILRPFFVVGPGQRASMAIPSVVGRVLHGQPVALQPGPADLPRTACDGLRFGWIDADDAAESVARLLDVPGSCTLNLAGSDSASIRSVAETTGRMAGREPCFVAATEHRTCDFLADNSALLSRVGPMTFRPLAHSLAAIVEWMRAEAISACGSST